MNARTLESTESESLSEHHSSEDSSSSDETLDDDLDVDEDVSEDAPSGPSSAILAKHNSSPGLTTIVGGSNGFITIGAGFCTNKELILCLGLKMECYLGFLVCHSFCTNGKSSIRIMQLQEHLKIRDH